MLRNPPCRSRELTEELEAWRKHTHSMGMKIEKIVLATEIKEQNPKVLKEVETLFAGQGIEVEFVSHVELKAQTKNCKAVIRTGETTPYANIILQAGCIFA